MFVFVLYLMLSVVVFELFDYCGCFTSCCWFGAYVVLISLFSAVVLLWFSDISDICVVFGCLICLVD